MDLEQKAIERIKTASEMSLEYYKQPLICTYSGGKDSDVLLELFKRSGVPFEVQHSHTTADAPQTVWHVRDNFKKLEKNSKKQKICEYCGKKFQSKVASNTCSDYCRHKQAQIRNARARINRGEKTNLDTLLKEREEYRNKVNDNKGGTRMNVKNQYGKEVNFDEALKLMDADLRENVAYELSLSSDQEFFDKYAEAHKKKFGTTWEPDRE